MQYQKELKICVLGDKECGKSALCLSYLQDRFVRDPGKVGMYNLYKKSEDYGRIGSYLLHIVEMHQWKSLTSDFVSSFDGFILLYNTNSKKSFKVLRLIKSCLFLYIKRPTVCIYVVGNIFDYKREQVTNDMLVKLSESLPCKYYAINIMEHAKKASVIFHNIGNDLLKAKGINLKQVNVPSKKQIKNTGAQTLSSEFLRSIKSSLSGEVGSAILKQLHAKPETEKHTKEKQTVRVSELDFKFIKINELLHALVQDQDSSREVSIFLLTYRTFTSPSVVFTLLLKEFSVPFPRNASPSMMKRFIQKELIPAQAQALKIILEWVTDYYDDFAEEDSLILSTLVAFLDSVLLKDPSEYGVVGTHNEKICKEIREKITGRNAGQKKIYNKIFETEPPKPLISKKFLKTRHFHALHPMECARQICLFDFENFQKIPMVCLVEYSIGVQPTEIGDFIKKSDAMSRWIAMEILSEKKIGARVSIIKHWIMVARYCYVFNSMHSMITILNGLSNAAVSRMTNTWKLVSKSRNKSKMFRELSMASSSRDNYKMLRKMQKILKPPYLPYFNLVLADLLDIDVASGDLESSKSINFQRRQRVASIIIPLEKLKDTPFFFRESDYVRVFLESIYSCDDEELYRLSYIAEPLQDFEDFELDIVDEKEMEKEFGNMSVSGSSGELGPELRSPRAGRVAFSDQLGSPKLPPAEFFEGTKEKSLVKSISSAAISGKSVKASDMIYAMEKLSAAGSSEEWKKYFKDNLEAFLLKENGTGTGTDTDEKRKVSSVSSNLAMYMDENGNWISLRDIFLKSRVVENLVYRLFKTDITESKDNAGTMNMRSKKKAINFQSAPEFAFNMLPVFNSSFVGDKQFHSELLSQLSGLRLNCMRPLKDDEIDNINAYLRIMIVKPYDAEERKTQEAIERNMAVESLTFRELLEQEGIHNVILCYLKLETQERILKLIIKKLESSMNSKAEVAFSRYRIQDEELMQMKPIAVGKDDVNYRAMQLFSSFMKSKISDMVERDEREFDVDVVNTVRNFIDGVERFAFQLSVLLRLIDERVGVLLSNLKLAKKRKQKEKEKKRLQRLTFKYGNAVFPNEMNNTSDTKIHEEDDILQDTGDIKEESIDMADEELLGSPIVGGPGSGRRKKDLRAKKKQLNFMNLSVDQEGVPLAPVVENDLFKAEQKSPSPEELFNVLSNDITYFKRILAFVDSLDRIVYKFNSFGLEGYSKRTLMEQVTSLRQLVSEVESQHDVLEIGNDFLRRLYLSPLLPSEAKDVIEDQNEIIEELLIEPPRSAANPLEFKSYYPLKPLKEGLLVKCGGRVKTWKERWFCLSDDALSYYASRNDRRPKGRILLSPHISVKSADKQHERRSNVFEVITTERTFAIQASTKNEMREWMKAIKRAISGIDSEKKHRESFMFYRGEESLVESVFDGNLMKLKQYLEIHINEETDLSQEVVINDEFYGEDDSNKESTGFVGIDYLMDDMAVTPVLHIIAIFGYTSILNEILDRKYNVTFDINQRDAFNMTALHHASNNSHVDIVSRIVHIKGVDINAECDHGQTPLHFACSRGSKKIIELLCAKGADVNKRSERGVVPLHLAAQCGFEAVKTLLVFNPDLNIRTKKELLTPLHLSCATGNAKIAELLLQEGCDFGKRDQYGRTPLHFATSRNHFEIAKMIVLRGGNPSAYDIKGNSPLFIAIKNHMDNFTKFFINQLALQPLTFQNYVCDQSGVSILHVASQHADLKTLELILRKVKKLLSMDERTLKGRTPLHYAVKGSNMETLRYLCTDNNVDINMLDDAGWGILHFAVGESSTPVINFLLGLKEIDLSQCDKSNNYPLHVASHSGDVEVVEMLLTHNSQATVANDFGDTPLHYASQLDHADIASLLLKHGADVNYRNKEGNAPLHLAAEGANQSVLRVLIHGGANIMISNAKGMNPLHVAALAGNTTVCEILFTNYAKVDSFDMMFQSALHKACLGGSLSCVGVILDTLQEIDKEEIINLKDINGENSLQLASLDYNEEIAKIILSKMCDINKVRKQGDISAKEILRRKTLFRMRVDTIFQETTPAKKDPFGTAKKSLVLDIPPQGARRGTGSRASVRAGREKFADYFKQRAESEDIQSAIIMKKQKRQTMVGISRPM